MDEEFLDLKNFPLKKKAKGSLLRKRVAIEKKYHRFKRLMFTHGYPKGGVYPADSDGYYDDKNPVYLKRYYRNHTSKQIKIKCNRKFRRENIREALPPSAHKKMTEYMWELA